jgi:hypothetical protein
MDRMPVSPIVTRVIAFAEDKLGIHELARRVNAPEMLLRAWRDGHATVPRDMFLRLVDVLLELNVGWDEWDRDAHGK